MWYEKFSKEPFTGKVSGDSTAHFVKSEGLIIYGKKEGEWLYFHSEKGYLMQVKNFKNGEYHGKYIMYSPSGSGEIMWEGFYINGELQWN